MENKESDGLKEAIRAEMDREIQSFIGEDSF